MKMNFAKNGNLLLMLLLVAMNACEPEKKKAAEIDAPQTIVITSSAFTYGGRIPPIFTCDGDDISPPLAWTNIPPETLSLAIICEDPDAPSGTFTHWLTYSIPPDYSSFETDFPKQSVTSEGIKQGKNDFGEIGYSGPCPPEGEEHSYFFKIYALNGLLPLRAGLNRDELLNQIKNNIIAWGQHMGTYKRTSN